MHSSPIVLLSSLAMPSHFLKRCCVSLRLIVKLACFTLVVSNYVDFHAHHWCAADILLSVTAPCQWWREKIPFSLIAAWHSSDSYNEKGPMIPQPSVNNMPDLFWRKLPVGREWIWVMWGQGWMAGGRSGEGGSTSREIYIFFPKGFQTMLRDLQEKTYLLPIIICSPYIGNTDSFLGLHDHLQWWSALYKITMVLIIIKSCPQ